MATLVYNIKRFILPAQDRRRMTGQSHARLGPFDTSHPIRDQATSISMASAEDEKKFLRGAAVDAIPKIAEIVCRFSPEDQAGALEVAERRFMQETTAVLKYLPDLAHSAIMRLLRTRLKPDRRRN